MSKPSLQTVLREIVVLAAFVASGGHIYQVAVDMGNHPLIALVHAVGLDGLVYIGIGAFKTSRVRGVIAVVYGGLMSLAFNWASYTTGTLPGWTIAASMPVSLVLAVVVAGAGDKAKTVPAVVPPPIRKSTPRAVPAPADVLALPAAHEDKPEGERKARKVLSGPERAEALELIGSGIDLQVIADKLGVSRKTIYRLSVQGQVV